MTGHSVDAAHAYAAAGWPVFPCHSVTATRGCGCGQPACGSAGKHPAVARGLHAATTDPRQVDRWWGRRPDANIAIRTGAPSGLVVIDIDPRHGGHDTWRDLQDRHGHHPTATVTTGGGGTHLYYQHPGSRLPNSAGRIGPGVDIRGDGGYILAPPSRHTSGRDYVWANDREPTALPAWLRDELRQPPAAPTRSPKGPVVAADRWAEAAVRQELAGVRHACEGTRNNTLNRAAFRLGQLVGAGLVDADDVHSHLVMAATDAGLTLTEADRTARSGLNAGQQRPRSPAPAVAR